jgi:hypothetical protein
LSERGSKAPRATRLVAVMLAHQGSPVMMWLVSSTWACSRRKANGQICGYWSQRGGHPFTCAPSCEGEKTMLRASHRPMPPDAELLRALRHRAA